MRTHGDLKPLSRKKCTHCPLKQYDQIWYQSRMQTNSIGGQAAMLQTTLTIKTANILHKYFTQELSNKQQNCSTKQDDQLGTNSRFSNLLHSGHSH